MRNKKYLAYINPYFVVSKGGNYTKHIYIGPRRIAYAGSDDDYVNGQGFCCDDATGLRAGNDNPELYQYYYHSDHLGSTSLITDLDGNIVQHVDYVPFGEVFIEERNNKWNTPYLFNAKELDEETGLYYYGARYYDPRVSLWLVADPMQEKYPNISTYAYCVLNPVRFVDPDGKDIKLYNVNVVDKNGNLKAQAGLSATTNAAMKDLLKTKEGLAFFAQFAKAGDAIGDYKFTKDGSLSNVTLNLWDYSADDIVMAQPGSGSIGVSEDKKTVTLKVVSNGIGKAEVGETLTHETQVHGYNIVDKIKGTSTTNENKDHKALKNQDTKHQGYKQYKSVQTQLEKIDQVYKKAFEASKKDYDKDY
jgi:RHS repeat-associated protein